MQPDSARVHIAGRRVRELRKLAGYNLVTFAPLAGITFQYLSQLERGKRKSVSPEVFARICDALAIQRDDRRQLIAGAA